MYPSRSVGRGENSTCCASVVDWPYSCSPVDDIIEVNESTRSGNSIAIFCAIMPPIEDPTTCARSTPSARSRSIPSHAMSRSEYGAIASARSTSPDMTAVMNAIRYHQEDGRIGWISEDFVLDEHSVVCRDVHTGILSLALQQASGYHPACRPP